MKPFNNLLLAVRDLADIYPDRRTERMYWDYVMDCPECIIGTALYRLDAGVKLEHNQTNVRSLNWMALGFSVPMGPQMEWLWLVQHATDSGGTWGEAVAYADRLFPFKPAAVA